jgi:predicted transcriptional regulator
MGDMAGLVDTIKKAVPLDGQPELYKRLSEGIFTLRDMYEQFSNILKMGPLNKVMEMLPGMGSILKEGAGRDSSQKIKSYMTIMDSMTDEELDDSKVLAKNSQSRIVRIARGSGRSVKEVNELLEQFKHFEKVMKKVKGLKLGKVLCTFSEKQTSLPLGALRFPWCRISLVFRSRWKCAGRRAQGQEPIADVEPHPTARDEADGRHGRHPEHDALPGRRWRRSGRTRRPW